MLPVALALILAAVVLVGIGVWAVASELHRLADHHMRFAPDGTQVLADGQELWINGVGLCVIAGHTDAGLPVADPRPQPGIVTTP